MSLQVEKMEKNMAKLTIEVSAEDLDKAMQNAYQKAKGRISIPGFRNGKAPRKMIEQMYGKGVFLEDAANALIPEHYSKALAECDLEIVSQPKIDVTQVEPGKPFIFTAEVATKPEVTLGDYKGLEVPKSETEVTDEEVEAELKKEQEKNSRTITVEDRAAQNGDTATIDFEGFVDGVHGAEDAFGGGVRVGIGGVIDLHRVGQQAYRDRCHTRHRRNGFFYMAGAGRTAHAGDIVALHGGYSFFRE